MATDESQNLIFHVRQAIARRPHAFKPNIKIQAKEQTVTLKGSVGSWYEKLMAQEALRHVEGLMEIDNQLVVSP